MCESVYIAVSRALSKAKPREDHAHQYKEQWAITVGHIVSMLEEFSDFDIINFMQAAEH